MGDEKKHSQLAITIIGWSLLLGAVFIGASFLHQFDQTLRKQYAGILSRVDQLAVSENNRYRYISIPNTKQLFLVEPTYKYTSQSDTWTLVNKNREIALTYVPADLVPVPMPTYNAEPLQVRKALVEPLTQLNKAAEIAGVHLMVRSAYRSSADQAAVTKEVDQGVAAQPGMSEHQTGLAVDFNNLPVECGIYCALNNTSALWLADNAYHYGFVLRYPEGKEVITGYPAEAWHYRYVGTRLAKALHDSGLTYDEFYALFVNARPRT